MILQANNDDIIGCIIITVFACHDAVKKPLQPPYDGPFSVLQRHNKHFTPDINGHEKVVSLTTSSQHLSNTLQHVQLHILLLLNHKHTLLQFLLQRLIFLNELPDQDAMFTGPRGLLATNHSPDCSLEGGTVATTKPFHATFLGIINS